MKQATIIVQYVTFYVQCCTHDFNGTLNTKKQILQSCESLRKISRVHDTTFEEIEAAYVKQNIPIIVIDAMNDWQIKNGFFGTTNITEVQ